MLTAKIHSEVEKLKRKLGVKSKKLSGYATLPGGRRIYLMGEGLEGADRELFIDLFVHAENPERWDIQKV